MKKMLLIFILGLGMKCYAIKDYSIDAWKKCSNQLEFICSSNYSGVLPEISMDWCDFSEGYGNKTLTKREWKDLMADFQCLATAETEKERFIGEVFIHYLYVYRKHFKLLKTNVWRGEDRD